MIKPYRKTRKLICPECGKRFVTVHPQVRYCAKLCQQLTNRRKFYEFSTFTPKVLLLVLTYRLFLLK